MKLITQLPWKCLVGASACASADETRLSICSVRLEPEDGFARVVATNGRILCALRIEDAIAKKDEALSIPSTMIQAGKFEGREMVEIYTDDDQIIIKNRDGMGIMAPKSTYEYPKWRSVIPSENKNRLGFVGVFNPELLMKLQEAANSVDGGNLAMYATGNAMDAVVCQGRGGNFFGILMPLREEWVNEKLSFPKWL